VAAAAVAAAEGLVPGLVLPLRELVPGPHSDLVVSRPDDARAPVQPVRVPVLVVARQPVEAQVPAQVPGVPPVRPAVAPVRGLRPRRPTAPD